MRALTHTHALHTHLKCDALACLPQLSALVQAADCNPPLDPRRPAHICQFGLRTTAYAGGGRSSNEDDEGKGAAAGTGTNPRLINLVLLELLRGTIDCDLQRYKPPTGSRLF